MKTISLFLFSVLLLPSYLLHAEDIRLANGRVLRNATVNRIASDGVIVTPEGFGATGTIYYWRYLHPEDAARFQAQREKEGRQAAAVAQIEQTSVVRAIKVTQVKDDGVLAQIAPAHVVEGNKYPVPNKASEQTFLRDGDWQDELVFIYLPNTKQMVDGEKSAGRLYSVGRLQYTSVLGTTKTVAAYAVSAEHALQIIRALSSKP